MAAQDIWFNFVISKYGHNEYELKSNIGQRSSLQADQEDER